MFILLGDPAFRLPAIAKKIKLEVDGQATAGSKIIIRGRIPDEFVGSSGQLTLERSLNSKPVGIKPLPPMNEIKQRAQVTLANHKRSNQFVLKELKVEPDNKMFITQLELPLALPWPKLIIRAYFKTSTTEGMGINILYIQNRNERKDKPDILINKK